MDSMKRARQLLAKQILSDFSGKITGRDIKRLTKANPENVFYVGKLMSAQDKDGNTVNTSKTFIESIGADFYIRKDEMDTAEVLLYPQGDFYYRAYPSLEEQQQALLEEANAVQTETKFKSIFELIDAYKADVATWGRISAKLVPTYKKKTINQDDFYVRFVVGDLLDPTRTFGFIDKCHALNSVELAGQVKKLQEEINQDEEAYRKDILEPTRISDLCDKTAYENFIKRNMKQTVETQRQSWELYFDVVIKQVKKGYLVSISLVNDSILQYSKAHLAKKDDKNSIETLFNSGIRIQLIGAKFMPIELDDFVDDYKYDKAQYAVGNNCTIVFNQNTNSVQTNHLPLYEQYRLLTNDLLAVRFIDLVEKPLETLTAIYNKMKVELKQWEKYRDSLYDNLTNTGRAKIDKEIKGFECEILRFKFGVDTIAQYPLVKQSFIQMNRAFASTSVKFSTWRLFQIVFIVSIVPDIVACDKNLMPDDDKFLTKLSDMALLYFPTGGGKTEAFLGVLIFNLFFDRHRGKSQGVTCILRYPLRLLSVQQVQRLANVLAQSELIRRDDPSIVDTEEFSLGYFVGDNNTPNSLEEKDYTRYREMTQEQRDENRVIDICPFCHQPTVHLRADEKKRRLIHFCDNPDCKSCGDLPLFIVDSEIYRYLPSAIISTVDKLAIMGCNANFRSILDGAKYRCPQHGYTTKTKCVERTCEVEVQDFQIVEMYDPAPTLFIQDELHLIRESLGTYASHYESFLRYYIMHLSKSKRDFKVIGATATISAYEQQVYHLYGRDPIRFPCESPYLDKNFYSYVDKRDLQRMIIGYAPYGKAIVNSVVFSLKYMREVVFEYFRDPGKVLSIPSIGIASEKDAIEILKDYWIFLEYNNVKRDGNNIEGALETPVNVELQQEGITPFIIRKMTGDESFQDVREVLAEVENNDDVFNGLNLIAATSMISHGVDADRFNIMFFYGIPGNMAEYIQAYSRTGRQHTSIVVDIIRPTRETDQSYLKNFESVHKFKDLLVESVPINRWATRAVENTISGVFSSLLLCHYDAELQHTVGTLFFMRNIKKAINQGVLDKEQIKEHIYKAYGCTDDEGIVQDLGNQYRLKISAFIEDVFGQVSDKMWENETLFDGFNRMGYRIMNSLRDTDAQLIIEME